MSSQQYAHVLAELLMAHSVAGDAIWMEGYMKNRFKFFGVKSPKRSELLRQVIEAHGLPDEKAWKGLTKICWQHEEREMQYQGMELAFRSKKFWTQRDLSFFEDLIINKSWWDTVDFIASNIIGSFLKKFPDLTPKIIADWRESDNMWLNRTALLFQLKYRQETDFDLLRSVIERHRNSKEFFIQKAVGWSLRQYAKVSQDTVRQYVSENNLAALSRREALKHF